MDKEGIKNKKTAIQELIGTFCVQKLDADYNELCEKLILKMGRKRDVPFQRGKIEIWAAAVVYAIGSINFLFDKSFEPYMTAGEISDYFGTKSTTVSSKAKQIKDMFDLWYFNTEFSTQHMNSTSLFNDLVMMDGFIVPISSIPAELQAIVKRERAEGRDVEFITPPE